MKKYKVLPAGFTLLEVALVLLIGGLMTMSAATMLIDYLSESRMVLTQNRMQDVDNAIIQYLNVNGVLPCPAKLNDAPDSTTFGRSITDGLPPGTDCYATSALPASGTYRTTGTKPLTPSTNITGSVIMGAVPIRSLNLPDQEMADAWGDRFVYTVTEALTVQGSYNPTLGFISVQDSNGHDIVGQTSTPPAYAQYAIVSYGADRAGAYSISGTKGGMACPASGPETNNCTYPTSTFTKTMLTSYQSGTGYFDDYVTYHSLVNSTGTVPTGIISPYAFGNGLNCPPGWQTLPITSCTAPSGGSCCQKQ